MGFQLPWSLFFYLEKLKVQTMPPAHRKTTEAVTVMGIPINSAIILALISYGALGIWYGAMTYKDLLAAKERIDIVEKKADRALDAQYVIGERLAKIESTGSYTLDAIGRIEKKIDVR